MSENLPTKNLIFLDAETYYDRDFSLRKMPTPNYILDPRFELQMCAVKVNDGPHEIIDGPDFADWIAQFDPKITTTVTFNALFDNSILAWRYGFIPATMLDAMAMARTLLGHEITNFSLSNVASHMGLGAKGTALQNMMGLNREQIIAAGLWDDFKAYALQDNFLCEQIFWTLIERMPWAERRLMDMTLRCAVEPRFRVDIPMLEQHLVDVKLAKEELIQAANGIDPKIIMSTKKFQEALEHLGVEVEMKTSPTTGKETPCFAKTDEFMERLQEHPDPTVAAMAAARIGLKSTLEETRTEKLLSIAKLDWELVSTRINLSAFAHGRPGLPIGQMPVPLRYGGAHTHRLSGEWGMNMQNMPTVRGSKGKSKLRQSLIVPDDCEVVTCDLSQIEARIVAWICGCDQLVEEFAMKKDPYSLLATEIFGRPINRKLPGMEIEGFIGKTGILGLGYGCGKTNFDTMVTRSARSMGMDISQKYNVDVGYAAVDAYRKRYWQIPQGWRTLDYAIKTVFLSGSAEQKFGPVTIGNGEVKLPSGLSLMYADIRSNIDPNTGYTEYSYRYGKFRHKIYGAKLLENIVQALARVVVMNAALRIRDRGRSTLYPRDYRYVLQAHDELVFIVHKTELENAKAIIQYEMKARPSWGLSIPIDCELGQGKSYGEAK
jgi:DNA polymerase family A